MMLKVEDMGNWEELEMRNEGISVQRTLYTCMEPLKE